MKINELFFELSHEGRYQILKLLEGQKKKHKEFEVELNLAGPEVSRHLKRLQKIGLLRKTTGAGGGYEHTSFGQLLCAIMPFFENSLSFVEFINSHDFSAIPIDLFLKLGSIAGVELKSVTMENIELWADLVKSARKFIFAITDQLQTSVIPLVQERVQSGGGA